MLIMPTSLPQMAKQPQPQLQQPQKPQDVDNVNIDAWSMLGGNKVVVEKPMVSPGSPKARNSF